MCFTEKHTLGKMTQTEFFLDCLASSGAYKYFNKNQWCESASGKTVKILNPTTNACAYEVQGGLV
jgi:hypothetical protein